MATLGTINSTSDGNWGVAVGGSPLLRYPAEPRSSLGEWVQKTTSAATSVGGTVLGMGAGLGDFPALLAEQVRIQQVMQAVSMYSNVERSRHEIEMAPIRNMRIG